MEGGDCVNLPSELGAAWVLESNTHFFPILMNHVSYTDMESTLLKGLQMLQLNEPDNISILYDELCKTGVINRIDTAQFFRKLVEFCAKVKKIENGTDLILHKDRDGYFKAHISEIRKVPDTYRCYRIRGKIEVDENYLEDESHWIFFRSGMYDDLQVGDNIRFKVSDTEVQQFKDLRNARNIYPAMLQKINE